WTWSLREKVLSRSRHSSTECSGSSKRCSPKVRAIWPVKSSMGLISSEGPPGTVGDQPLKGLALDGDEVGDWEDLGDLAEGESRGGRGTRVAQQASLPFRGKQGGS